MTSEPKTAEWYETNQRFLAEALSGVRTALQRYVAQHGPTGGAAETELAARTASASWPAPSTIPLPALEALCGFFGLSSFERNLLLMCAGMELDAGFTSLYAAAHGDPQQAYPTFSLALAALPDAHWSALSPVAPLRRQRLIEIGPGLALTLSPLRIDERILNYLAGIDHPDQRLSGLIEPVPATGELVPSHQNVADQIVGLWTQTADQALPPAIQLCGTEVGLKRSLAAAACMQIGLTLSAMPAEAIPSNLAEMETLLRLWEREAVLSRSALLLECDEIEAASPVQQSAVARMIERIPGPVLISSLQRHPMRRRAMITFEVGKATLHEQRFLWRQALGPAAEHLNGHLERLSAQFDVSAQVIRAAGTQALGEVSRQSSPDAADDEREEYAGRLVRVLWGSCRVNSRPRIDDLAQRVDAKASWEDLVLPEAQQGILRDIAAHVRQRSTVYETWGFAAKGSRGLGISALFAGTSGTGKTMSAEVLARELSLDLYRIDLSAVVSKYIGESEKNLRRVFDAAEEGGAILLFDEADALFGKRSETKDSHDRYSNIEVSYLLQRMESYRGLAILTTNLKKSLDTAFLRRLRFIIEFPYPDAPQRAEIWRRSFPADAPTDGLDYQKLARLNMSGGNIRNTALNAAFYAADAGEPVQMIHCLRAAQSEYVKLEKTLTGTEIAGWV